MTAKNDHDAHAGTMVRITENCRQRLYKLRNRMEAWIRNHPGEHGCLRRDRLSLSVVIELLIDAVPEDSYAE